MQSTSNESLAAFARLFQGTLFARLECEVGTLSQQAQLLAMSVANLRLPLCFAPSRGWRGRPAKDRQALATAFLAKAIYGLDTTRQLLERLRVDTSLRRLCGWMNVRQLPHESTFSRAFAEFAQRELPQRLHQLLIERTQKDRLIGHIARDATAIEAREKFPESKPAKSKRQPRPKRAKACQRGTRLERQRKETLAQQLAALPRQCSIGTKKSSKGHQQYWRGYKLHLDVADGQIPISALLTGASVHDSQAAIPLMTMSTQRVTYLYE